MPHPNSRAARATRRRKRRMALVEHDLTAEQWATLKQLWGGCAYCGASDRALQRDCVQPIARGGRYTLDNIVPACGSCNASKSNAEVTSWMRRKQSDERGFLVRFVEVRAALATHLAGPPLCADEGTEGRHDDGQGVTTTLPRACPSPT